MPNFGVMLNDDGDHSYPDADPVKSLEGVRRMIGSLRDTPVRTLMYSIGAGSDILYYPTHVANTFGWRTTPLDDDPVWSDRVHRGRIAAQAGADPVRAAAEQAHAMGLRFVPSYRMNDAHFVIDPEHYPLTGKFWLEHRQFAIGQSPVAGWNYSALFDFSHEEVREFRLAVIYEALERYAPVMDGFELDFNRFQIFFRPGEAGRNRGLVTAMVARVRAWLDELGAERGRTFYLFVRVPPTLKNCEWSGLDVPAWMRERLVDVVIPAQFLTLAHEMPVDEFVALARPEAARIYPALYDWTNWRALAEPVPLWNFSGDSGEIAGSRAMTRFATPALIAGAVANYHAMGADGFQLYNFKMPLRPEHQEAARILAQPETIPQRARIYAVTHAYFNDNEDSFQYRKQLPQTLRPGATCSVSLLIGEDPSAARERPVLRLGVRGVTARSHLVVRVNGHPLADGAGRDLLTPAAPQTRADTATHYLLLPLDPRWLQAKNHIELTADSLAPSASWIACEAGFAPE